MKKLIPLFLSLLLILPVVALAAEFNSLRDLQDYIYKTSTMTMREVTVQISGTISEITFIKGNHYNMLIMVDEERAASPVGSDFPCFIAHIRFHDPYIKYKPGDAVEIVGKLNPLYSSHLIPFVLVDTVNGSDNF